MPRNCVLKGATDACWNHTDKYKRNDEHHNYTSQNISNADRKYCFYESRPPLILRLYEIKKIPERKNNPFYGLKLIAIH